MCGSPRKIEKVIQKTKQRRKQSMSVLTYNTGMISGTRATDVIVVLISTMESHHQNTSTHFSFSSLDSQTLLRMHKKK
jgi:hypothetical protein